MNGSTGANQPEETTVYQDGNLRIMVRNVADSAVIDLLKHTVYGTSGVQYQHIVQEQKIHQLHTPLFFHLFLGDALIGIYCLDERSVSVAPERLILGYYGRYLSIKHEQQGKGYGRLLKVQAVRYVENHRTEPCLFYSYIEEKNSRSLEISRSEGFTSIATLKTFIFRRYAPSADSRCSRLPMAAKPTLITKLKQQYSNHVLAVFAKIGYQDNYFVLTENEEIIAGVQANPTCWKFSSVPGLLGWFMMHVVPALSATRRFFNPKEYEFVALEGIYFQQGREDGLLILLESVLAHFGYHSALLQVDTKDPLNALLTNTKKMGFLSGFQASVNTYVMVKTHLSALPSSVADNPVYVSSFDFT